MQTSKSILLHLDSSPRNAERVEVARQLAQPFAIGGTVLVAWKEAREAARAVSASLPWLRRARQAHAIAWGDTARKSLDALSLYLQGQGVEATLHSGGPREDAAGDHLPSFAADVGADLLVMGCHGHTRKREWVPGSVTRAILQSMTLPVLMAH